MKKLIYLFALLLMGLLAGPQTTYAQVKIGANAKTIGSSSNLEVEAAKKLSGLGKGVDDR